MKNSRKNCFDYYMTGQFLAKTMLDGLYNGDLKKNNIGRRNACQRIFVDGGNLSTITNQDCKEIFDGVDVEVLNSVGVDKLLCGIGGRIEKRDHYREFKIPEELTQTLITKFSRTLVSMLFDSEGKQITLSQASYFRAGFVSRGGRLGHIIFSSLSNRYFSSFSYTGKKDRPNYILPDVPSKGNVAFSVEEWKRVFAREQETDRYHFPASELSRINRHYWNIFEISRKYIAFEMIGDIQAQNELIVILADQCYRIGLFHAAYGLSQKYRLLSPPDFPGNLLANDIQRSIKDECFLASEDMALAENYVKKYSGLFNIWWILYDLDTLNGQVKSFVNKNEF